MAWYNDRKAQTHLEIYKDTKDATRESDRAARNGWVIQNTAVAPSQIRWMRSLLRGFIFGPVRRNGQVTITYVRSKQP